MSSYLTKTVDLSKGIVEDTIASILYWSGEVNDDHEIPLLTISPNTKGGYTVVYTTKKRREIERIGA